MRLRNTCSSWRNLLRETIRMMQLIRKWRKITTDTIESYLVSKPPWPLSSMKPRASQLAPMSSTCATWHALTKSTLRCFRIRDSYYTEGWYWKNDEISSDWSVSSTRTIWAENSEYLISVQRTSNVIKYSSWFNKFDDLKLADIQWDKSHPLCLRCAEEISELANDDPKPMNHVTIGWRLYSQAQ